MTLHKAQYDIAQQNDIALHNDIVQSEDKDQPGH